MTAPTVAAPIMTRRIFTPWDVLWLLALPTMYWAPYAELRGLAIAVLLIYATLAVARTLWELAADWCVPTGVLTDAWFWGGPS